MASLKRFLLFLVAALACLSALAPVARVAAEMEVKQKEDDPTVVTMAFMNIVDYQDKPLEQQKPADSVAQSFKKSLAKAAALPESKVLVDWDSLLANSGKTPEKDADNPCPVHKVCVLWFAQLDFETEDQATAFAKRVTDGKMSDIITSPPSGEVV